MLPGTPLGIEVMSQRNICSWDMVWSGQWPSLEKERCAFLPPDGKKAASPGAWRRREVLVSGWGASGLGCNQLFWIGKQVWLWGSEEWGGQRATLLVLALTVLQALVVLPASRSSPVLIFHKALSKMRYVSQHALSLTEDEQGLSLISEGSLLCLFFFSHCCFCWQLLTFMLKLALPLIQTCQVSGND